jgi:EmrB/QacA subfamily drug resistance transporter
MTGLTLDLTAASGERDRRWFALVFIALAQLMIALDATVVNVALPTIQRVFGSSDAERQWIITAYTVAFAGCLLLGGAIADAMGHLRAFRIGLIGFAASSLVGGAAPSFALLVAARALQGVCAALLAPSALALLAVTFRQSHERARAFAVYGAVAGSGGAIGLVLGGWLTQTVGFRYCLYVNILFALIALGGIQLTLRSAPRAAPRKLDLPSAGLATAGLAAIVYACASALRFGWTALPVLGALALGVVSVGLFGIRQRLHSEPLLPPHILADRNRGGAALAAGLAIVAMFGLFLLLTYYFQAVQHYSPLHAGLAFLPMSLASLCGSSVVASRLLPRVPPRVVLVGGLLVAAAGLANLTRLSAGLSYASGILPSELAVGFGISCAMITAFSVGTQGVAAREAGIASAAIATAQQIGGSLGVALLNTIAASASASYIADHGGQVTAAALVHGYAAAASCGCGVLLAAAAIAVVSVNAPNPSALVAVKG